MIFFYIWFWVWIFRKPWILSDFLYFWHLTGLLFFKKNRWESLADEPYKRKLNFLPKKHDCLRKVPMYERFINERFERCLDLYLAPRARKMRLTIQPEDLVPQLPKPHDLQVNFVKNPLFKKVWIFPPKNSFEVRIFLQNNIKEK